MTEHYMFFHQDVFVNFNQLVMKKVKSVIKSEWLMLDFIIQIT